MPAYDENKSIEFGLAAANIYKTANKPFDGGQLSVYSMRCAYDYYTGRLTWEAARDGHLNGLRAALGVPTIPVPPTTQPWEQCNPTPDVQVVECVNDLIKPPHTTEGAFEVTKRVAWLLRGQGYGLLIKNGGENTVVWKGQSFAAARICMTDGHLFKILTDVPTTNGPSWQDEGVQPAQAVNFVFPIDPR